MSCEFVLSSPSNHLDFGRHGSDVQWRLSRGGLAAEVLIVGRDRRRDALRRHGLAAEIQIAGAPSVSGTEGLAAWGSAPVLGSAHS